MSDQEPRKEEGLEPDEARPLTGEPVISMRLRPEAPRVTRLSRKFLAGVSLIAGLGLGGALIYALQTSDGSGPAEELYSTENRTTADGLSNLPRDYTGPILGPPLPGDLGRPILDAQKRGQTVPAPEVVVPEPSLSEEERRRQEEMEAARTSRLFASTETTAAAAEAPGSDSSMPPAGNSNALPDLASLGIAPEPATPTAEERRLAFLNATPDKRTIAPDRVAAPASPNILQAGAVIPAALITGIRSELPGQITAQVTENVHDSPTGRILLIPQGARLIGQYDSGVGYGQRRVLLVWNRLIMPNGRSIVLERQPGADSAGYAGLEDRVDYHWGQLFRAAALSTLLSIGAEAGSSSEESGIVRALRRGASDSISETGQQIVERQLDIAPTLTIRPGFPVRVLVTRDLVLEPYGGS
ncbi:MULTISPECIES: TrbI/VirB10 family protein [unclassified Ensifer]|uniref:TrbI/VirB10 family protein n=1 Tax=unclassified Ensifer TaxID=2633371 RepID=UPI0030103F31